MRSASHVRSGFHRAGCAVAACVALAAGSVAPPVPPPEASSELADLWRERDAFFLKVDDRLTKEPGIAPRGARLMAIRLEAMTRGREFPGRYTMLELEVKPAAAGALEVGIRGGPAVRAELSAGTLWRIRLPLPETAGDLIVRPAGTASLAGPLEFRRIRLVDDRWKVWSDGWSVERVAGVFHLVFTTGKELTLPCASNGKEGWELVETNAVRARLVRAGRTIAVYATGAVFGGEGGETTVSMVEPPRLNIRIAEDSGRLDRNTPGDEDGDGFNEMRGATIVKLAERRASFTIAPGGRNDAVVRRPAIELENVPPGTVTVLWEGTRVKAVERLEDGRVLLEIPGDVRSETRVEVAVEAEAVRVRDSAGGVPK